ncbi:N-acetylmuramoyl-L-alanine amidase [Ruminococcus sp. AF41-9]|nr:N-acetylmuramoyl-L-alanine amidase [Blautia obeum]RHO89003.1 N-acetylmuramoyl-L-alanine amidase [Ruminococcus sp. AF41-9]
MSIINKYNLTKYDQAAQGGVSTLKINQNQNFGTHNTSPRSGGIEYIVIHYVGATGTAKNNIDYYNQRSTTQASADFYVGFEGEIWQYNPNPKARYCWAVGGGRQSSQGGSLYGVARNANSVSIEMCVRNKGNKNANSKDWYFEQATINSAIELTKYLMKLYGVPASRVIRHFDVNGKYCPGVYGWNSASGSESAWNDFKKKIGSGTVATPATPAQPTTAKKYYRVRKSWADAASQKGAFTSLANAKACAGQNSGYKVFDWNGSQVYPAAAFQPYQVRVEITDLRIRKGAGTNYDYWTEKNGQSKYTGKGTFTIVKEKNGAGATKWGLLKAYEKNADGWISLDYVKRV